MRPDRSIIYVREAQFFEAKDVPNIYQYDLPYVPLQQELNKLVEEERGEKGNIGELFRVIELTNNIAGIAIFDITTGQQVGYANACSDDAHEDQAPRGLSLFKQESEPSPEFTTSLAIATPYTRRGYGFMAREYMKKFIASHYNNGVDFREANTAEGDDFKAVQQILRRSGARRHPEHPRLWTEYVPNPERDIPLTVSATSLVFESKDIVRGVNFGKEFERRGNDLYYQGVKVAKLGRKEVSIVQPEDDTQTFWQGVDLLWRNAIKTGLKASLQF